MDFLNGERNMHLAEAEENLMNIIWAQAPLPSKKLIEICAKEFDWKKSTTYTLLRRLIDKGMAANENATVTACVSQDDYRYSQGKSVIEKYYHDSLPCFLTAFAKEEKLSKTDIEELEKIIDSFK